eukprot:9490816-Pyramimonas_sp.AAC.1
MLLACVFVAWAADDATAGDWFCYRTARWRPHRLLTASCAGAAAAADRVISAAAAFAAPCRSFQGRAACTHFNADRLAGLRMLCRLPG